MNKPEDPDKTQPSPAPREPSATTEAVILFGNVFFVAGAFYLFDKGRITWEQAGVIIAAVAFPSYASIAAKRIRKGPPPDGGAAMALLVAALATRSAGFGLVSCAALDSPAAKYKTELVACNASAQTLRESIECEDRVRAAYGREPRDAGAPLPDADAGDASSTDGGR